MTNYLHGYSREEQDRLLKQARVFEKSIYEHVDLSRQTRLLEIGCGVGAQTQILLERFPGLHVQGIDASAPQLERARSHLAAAVAAGRASFVQGDALKLPVPDSAFDSAFVCWFLEHLADPTAALREIRRALAPGGVVYCTEVLNATFYLHPYSPATLQYWFAFNDWQWTMQGDPFVGGKLANLLLAAGFQEVSTEVKVHHFDNRAPKARSEFIEDRARLLLSGADNLIAAGKVTAEVVTQMTQELETLKTAPDAVYFDAFVQARARAY